MNDWRAHLSSDATDWATDTRRLTLYRRPTAGNVGHQIIGWHQDTGTAIVEAVEDGARLRPGFAIPTEALDSLRDQLAPGPTQRELDQLREALEHERARSADHHGDLVRIASELVENRPPAVGTDSTLTLTPYQVEALLRHLSAGAPDRFEATPENEALIAIETKLRRLADRS